MNYVTEEKRVVALTDQKNEMGQMTWSNAGESIIIIDSTHVVEEYRGQNVAENLIFFVIEYARKKNKKIMPLCPFAKKEFDKHPEYHDVLF